MEQNLNKQSSKTRPALFVLEHCEQFPATTSDPIPIKAIVRVIIGIGAFLMVVALATLG